MRLDRRAIIQLLLAAIVAWSLSSFAPLTPSDRLSAAVNYKYRQIMTNLAGDGVY